MIELVTKWRNCGWKRQCLFHQIVIWRIRNEPDDGTLEYHRDSWNAFWNWMKKIKIVLVSGFCLAEKGIANGWFKKTKHMREREKESILNIWSWNVCWLYNEMAFVWIQINGINPKYLQGNQKRHESWMNPREDIWTIFWWLDEFDACFFIFVVWIPRKATRIFKNFDFLQVHFKYWWMNSNQTTTSVNP